MAPARHLFIVGFALLLSLSTEAQVAPPSPSATARLADAREGTVGSDGSTPLHQAVRANDLKTVDALIKRGANVKAVTSSAGQAVQPTATGSTPEARGRIRLRG